MKTSVLFALVFSITSLSASASSEVLVTKLNNPGYTTLDRHQTQRCLLFSDRVEIMREFGTNGLGQATVTMTEVRRVETTGELARLVANATAESIQTKPNNVCDDASTETFMGQDRDNVLDSSGGCGTPTKFRKGPASRILLAMINAYCPENWGTLGSEEDEGQQ